MNQVYWSHRAPFLSVFCLFKECRLMFCGDTWRRFVHKLFGHLRGWVEISPALDSSCGRLLNSRGNALRPPNATARPVFKMSTWISGLSVKCFDMQRLKNTNDFPWTSPQLSIILYDLELSTLMLSTSVLPSTTYMDRIVAKGRVTVSIAKEISDTTAVVSLYVLCNDNLTDPPSL